MPLSKTLADRLAQNRRRRQRIARSNAEAAGELRNLLAAGKEEGVGATELAKAAGINREAVYEVLNNPDMGGPRVRGVAAGGTE